MRTITYILLAYVTSTQSSIYSNLKDNILSLFDSQKFDVDSNLVIDKSERNDETLDDIEIARQIANVIKRNRIVKSNVRNKIPDGEWKVEKQYLPVSILNTVKRRAASLSDSESSSRELEDWKEQWKKEWTKKKIEAFNVTTPKGDVVNMVAARPRGKHCGDPTTHDMPWGTCTFPAECDPELRIFRGDFFCGRTQFVCCAVMNTAYDLYQGFDVSFADSSLETDSEELKKRKEDSGESKDKKAKHDQIRRRDVRMKRKKHIKEKIDKIVKEIKRLLNKAYKTGTSQRKKKTKELKKFVKKLKKQYKKDRKSVRDIHEIELIKIDADLKKKLNELLVMDNEFLKNSTYRDIIVNGTITKQMARTLVKQFPALSPYFDLTRRSSNFNPPQDYLDYDIEYGLMYY